MEKSNLIPLTMGHMHILGYELDSTQQKVSVLFFVFLPQKNVQKMGHYEVAAEQSANRSEIGDVRIYGDAMGRVTFSPFTDAYPEVETAVNGL